MSRPKNTTRLPQALEQELGLQVRSERKQNGPYRFHAPANRKDQRKAQRVEKRESNRGGSRPGQNRDDTDGGDEEPRTANRVKNVGPAAKQPALKQKNPSKANDPKPSIVPAKTPQKSILKKSRERNLTPDSDVSAASSRSSSPGLVLDANSKAFQDRAEQDDEEISALEKKLGLKKRKLPQSFNDDGLGDLLDGLDDDVDRLSEKKESQDWLKRKRQRSQQAAESESDEEDEVDGDDHLLFESDKENDIEDGSISEDLDENDPDLDQEEEDGFSGFDSADEDSEKPQLQVTRTRENPYVAPVSASSTTTKYVPPSLRKLQGSDGQSLERLKRQIQGHLNKLSEANLISILAEVEKIYSSNPRQDVTTVLVDLLLSLFCDKALLQNTFVILHASFCTAVYKVTGTDFGAELLVKLCERFEMEYLNVANSKASSNLISLMANLFTFHMISANIIFDHIRILLQDLTESSTELLLRVIRDCGPQLRQDDPGSLKSIVNMMQEATKRATDAGQTSSVRTQYMMETVIDLKNNKMKEATNAAGATKEHITRMRKVLGSLNNRNLRASEPLRISLNDIKNSDKKGKWWLIGASWKGNEAAEKAAVEQELNIANDAMDIISDNEEVDLLALARQYRMNTDIRRSIFIAIMSAYNFQDAYMRISKLRLKRAQEPEVAKVLLRCASSEDAYNPYYAVLAKRICGKDRRMRKTFEFALWDFFKKLGEKGGDDDDDDDNDDPNDDAVRMEEIANIGKMFAYLIAEGALSLGVLRVLDLALLREKGQIFVEFLLVNIFVLCRGNDNDVAKVFRRCEEAPQIISRLQLFVRDHVRKSDLVAKKDKEYVRIGCKVALRTLSHLSSSMPRDL